MLQIDTATGAVRQVLPGSDGLGVHGSITGVRLSGDGSQVVFVSDDPGLVPGDDNATTDIFEASLATGAVTLVSAAKDGTAGSVTSFGPAVSSDGRYVSFVSSAFNLVRGGRTHGNLNVFRRDLVTRTTQLVSNELSPRQQELRFNCDISADGQRVSYTSAQDGQLRATRLLYVRDMAEATPLLVASGVDTQALSPDGRTVSYDEMLRWGGGKSLGAFQVEIDTGLTKAALLPYRAPNQIDKYQILATSIDGRFVLFRSSATNLTAHPGKGTPTLFRSDMTQL